MSTFSLPALPYAKNGLEPYISEETIAFHYGKHHQAYVDNLNKLIINTEFEQSTIEEIVKKSTGGIFNNGAQYYNHTIYWNCMCPKNDAEPTRKLLEAINKDFGVLSEFKEQFIKAGMTVFGSGWVWLAQTEDGKLEILQTTNADTPFRIGKTPLLACDVWEHSYYIDRRNNRAAYLEAFWDIINWNAVEARLK